jgi:intraflagellar transport protein 88
MFSQIITRVPTDPIVYHKLGKMYAKDNDETNSYNCYLEAYKYYPVILDVISWLGLYFVNSELYEKALPYFEKAAKIEPKNVDWRMLVASCYRKILAFQQAKNCYENILKDFPDNVESLKYLVQICAELNLKKEVDEYSEKLKKLEERNKNQPQEVLEKIKKKDENIKNDENEIDEPKSMLDNNNEIELKRENPNDKKVESEDIFGNEDTDYVKILFL